MTRSYPNTRLRRLRANTALRALVAEHRLAVTDLILPVFIHDGNEERQAIAAMPDVYRLSLTGLLRIAEQAQTCGIQALALFPVISVDKKTADGRQAYDDTGLVPTAVQMLKQQFPDLLVITDVALDPYTTHGHDGIVGADGQVLNDATISILCQQALCQAQAGADVVAPSDMMDGRIGKIRATLEEHDQQATVIMSYAAKYASNFYQPFRNAVQSLPNLHSGEAGSDKRSYQMQIANAREALVEAKLDADEGADILLVKPALTCLDIIAKITASVPIPTFAYQVSGEYVMLKTTKDLLPERECVLESLLAIKRAGATAILTYYALDAAAWLS
ncbi:MAG: porphobilinogen synthase [Pseudomonadota bacterium]|nr:porphobilinogen synthase [Pseudomonadota bacterium]